jgi:hypothetical protein
VSLNAPVVSVVSVDVAIAVAGRGVIRLDVWGQGVIPRVQRFEKLMMGERPFRNPHVQSQPVSIRSRADGHQILHFSWGGSIERTSKFI